MIGITNRTDLEALRHAQAIDGMLDRALNDNQRLREEEQRLRWALIAARSAARARSVLLMLFAGLLFLTWSVVLWRWVVR